MNISQQMQILDYLMQGHTITPAEAIHLCNCYRLSAVIHVLRKQGFDIITYKEKNTLNSGTHARYELMGELEA